VHRSIASDHIIPEHVWSVHAEHDLWPLGKTKKGQHVGSPGKVQEVAGLSHGMVLKALETVVGSRGDMFSHTDVGVTEKCPEAVLDTLCQAWAPAAIRVNKGPTYCLFPL
jgi:hypothetical protein